MTWLDEESCVQHSALALEMIGQNFINTYTLYRFVKKKKKKNSKPVFENVNVSILNHKKMDNGIWDLM